MSFKISHLKNGVFALNWKCFEPPISGVVSHLNYGNSEDVNWEIFGKCEKVNIYSTMFDTESNYDYLHVGNVTHRRRIFLEYHEFLNKRA